MTALTFSQALKYRADQARDERGRWTSEGGSGRGGKKPKSEAERRAERNARERERRRQRAFEGRQRERAASRPKYREVPRLISKQGATRAEEAIRSALSRIPEDHYNVVKGVRYFAIQDMGKFGSGKLGQGKTVATFMPLLGVTVGQSFDGIPLLNPEHSAVHETAHALDYWAANSIFKSYALSKRMEPTLREEWEQLPEVVKFYAEHYEANQHPREVFAELYTAVYGPPHTKLTGEGGGGGYMGALTRNEVFHYFPKSIAALKSLDVRDAPNWDYGPRYVGPKKLSAVPATSSRSWWRVWS